MEQKKEMKNEVQILLTKVFLLSGTVGGLGLQALKDADLILGLLLKGFSIVSFVVVIVINWPKFVKTIKTYTKKSAKTTQRNND